MRASRLAGRIFIPLLALGLPCRDAQGAEPPVELVLASGGRTPYAIVLEPDASEPEALAAAELARYLRRMSGAAFPVERGTRREHAIVLRTAGGAGSGRLTGEAYSIATEGRTLYLTGGTPRAVLYAAYDLLERLGCQWLAPQLDLYAGAAEVVPSRPTLVYAAAGDVVERPVFSIRKIDVEEGLTHDAESLRRIVEWMPKARYNTLQVPMDYNGTGRVRWDRWREALTPELVRRGITIEVGGHGYQNFLNAEMEEGGLFERHPEWFGRDAECRPSRAERHVFNTESPDAVAYLADRIVRYLAERPEIDVFDFWPPDGARWAECAEQAALGTPEDRQARLVNAVRERLRAVRPDVRLEIIAYAHAKEPPQSVVLSGDVLVDFCPIGQNFDAQIHDPAGSNNAIYVEAIRAWRRKFSGDIGLYSYYRKYAWRSLPVVIPRYMQRDLQWYASVPLQGVSTYAEPGDWFTYELNHYALGRLAWSPDADVEALVDRFTRGRYGDAAPAARAALTALEEIVRVYGSIPYSKARPAAEIARARATLDERAAAVRAARAAAADTATVAAHLERLTLMLDFARRDLEIQEARAAGAAPEVLRGKVDALVAFLTAHEARGVFLLHGRDPRSRFMKHYGVPAAATSAAGPDARD